MNAFEIFYKFYEILDKTFLKFFHNAIELNDENHPEYVENDRANLIFWLSVWYNMLILNNFTKEQLYLMLKFGGFTEEQDKPILDIINDYITNQMLKLNGDNYLLDDFKLKITLNKGEILIRSVNYDYDEPLDDESELILYDSQVIAILILLNNVYGQYNFGDIDVYEGEIDELKITEIPIYTQQIRNKYYYDFDISIPEHKPEYFNTENFEELKEIFTSIVYPYRKKK